MQKIVNIRSSQFGLKEELYRIADSITGESWKCQLLILVGILLGSGIACMFILLPTLWHH